MNLISKTVRIKHKLIAINLFTTGVAFLLAVAVLILHEFVSSRDSLLYTITAQAKIIGSNSAAPLIFNDQRAAGETLSALKASPNIVYAAVYAKDGSVFAEYWRADSEKDFSPPAPGEDGYSFADNHLNIFQSIILDREKIGTIYIRSDLEKLYSLMMRHGVTAIIAIAFAFGIAFILLSKLQKEITKPILHLSELMQSVSRYKDYSLKAKIFSEDEIGSMAKGFNEMLEQIQERDMKLQIEITERKRSEEALRESEERYQAIVENTVLGIAIMDTNYKIIVTNATFAKLFRKSPSDFVGKYCFREYERREAVCSHCPGTRAMASGNTAEVETHTVLDDGTYVYVRNRAIPLFGSDGVVKGFIEVVENITERKQAEEEIQKLNQELEQKVEERTKQLREAQEDLVRKEKLAILGQLAGGVGHELRNPLGVINNAIYFLKTVMPDADETTKEYLNIIKDEVDNSQRIISDLLDFSRTKTPQPKLVNVNEMINQNLGKCVIPENITVHVDIPETLPTVKVDPLQMGQVFHNLIINAVQAMPDGGTLEIRAEEDREANALGISVTDTGHGISPENMEKLFQPLFTTKAKGIGLGLVVSKRLTEANGGKIEVESQPGKGTTFTVILTAEM